MDSLGQRALLPCSSACSRAPRCLPITQDCFGLDVILVPIPRSSPRRAGFLWPAERICACLLAEGLGCDILRCLERTQPVNSVERGRGPAPQSARSLYASITVRSPRPRAYPNRITLVDDVITRGSSFVGMVPRIQEVFPDTTVRCLP